MNVLISDSAASGIEKANRAQMSIYPADTVCLLAHSLEMIEQSIVEYLEVDPIIIPLLSSDLDRFMHLATDTKGLSLGDRMLAAQQETALDCILFVSV